MEGEDQYIAEAACPDAGWDGFLENIKSPTASLVGIFKTSSYRFTIAFFVARRGRRYVLFSLEGRNIDAMGASLKDKGVSFLEFLAEMHVQLAAKSMVLGFNADVQSLIAFLDGKLGLEEVDEYIRVAMGDIPPASRELLLSNPGTQQFDFGQGVMLSRWLPE